MQNKKESGRSLIEILGVLAIMGFLSIGGIVGYSLAMDRFQANDILDVSNKYAMRIFDSCEKILSDGKTGLVSLQYCSPATPGIPKFLDAKIGGIPHAIQNTGILFSKVKKMSDTVFEIHIEHRLNSKAICESLMSITHQKNGCTEKKAPYIITIPFRHY